MMNKTPNPKIDRLIKWLLIIAGIVGYLVLLGWTQTRDQQAALFEAYANGMAEGIAVEEQINRQRNSEKAMQWWVGSDDLIVVRDRLCVNYNRPKVK